MDTNNDLSLNPAPGLRLGLGDQQSMDDNDIDDGGGDQLSLTVATQSGGGVEAKRKRGRPRKESVAAPDDSTPTKRGRGRPKGSGKWQGFDSSSLAHSDASSFTPRVVTVQTGENIVELLSSLTPRPTETVCMLSSLGTLSTVELFEPCSSDVVRTYEGLFEIVSLQGSVSNDGTKQCRLNIQLTKPDGYLLAGRVADTLIAAAPSRLIVATYKQKPKRSPAEASKPKNDDSSSAAAAAAAYDGELHENDNVYRVSPLRVDDSAVSYRPELNQQDLSNPFDWAG